MGESGLIAVEGRRKVPSIKVRNTMYHPLDDLWSGRLFFYQRLIILMVFFLSWNEPPPFCSSIILLSKHALEIFTELILSLIPMVGKNTHSKWLVFLFFFDKVLDEEVQKENPPSIPARAMCCEKSMHPYCDTHVCEDLWLICTQG